MAFDLGQFGQQLITGATQVALARYAQKTQPPVMATPAFNPTTGGILDLFGSDLSDTGVGNTGQVIRPMGRRRRRRRLATLSDIRDLAALKAILGNGENFKVWIATHSRL